MVASNQAAFSELALYHLEALQLGKIPAVLVALGQGAYGHSCGKY